MSAEQLHKKIQYQNTEQTSGNQTKTYQVLPQAYSPHMADVALVQAMSKLCF